jgi:septal ring factor EnvC (AmiA/AmiB activator)
MLRMRYQELFPNNRRVAVALIATLCLLGTGCVRSSSYQSLKKELDDVRLQYETEKLRTQDIKSENRKLKHEIAELDGKFKSWREQLARTEQEWKELAARVFSNFSTNIVTGVNRLSYTCIIAQCYKNTGDLHTRDRCLRERVAASPSTTSP